MHLNRQRLVGTPEGGPSTGVTRATENAQGTPSKLGEQRPGSAVLAGVAVEELEDRGRAGSGAAGPARPGAANRPASRMARRASGNDEDDQVERADLARGVADVAVQPVPVAGHSGLVGLVPDRIVATTVRRRARKEVIAAAHQALGGTRSPACCAGARSRRRSTEHDQHQEQHAADVQRRRAGATGADVLAVPSERVSASPDFRFLLAVSNARRVRNDSRSSGNSTSGD